MSYPKLSSLCLKRITSNFLGLHHLQWHHCRLLVAKRAFDLISATQLLALEKRNPILIHFTSSVWERLLSEAYPNIPVTPTSLHRDLFLIQWKADQARAHQLALKVRQKYHELSSSKPSIRSTNKLVPDKRSRHMKTSLAHASVGVKLLEREKKLLQRDRPVFCPTPPPSSSKPEKTKSVSLLSQIFGHIT